jgi:hypothetical protein
VPAALVVAGARHTGTTVTRTAAATTDASGGSDD